MCTGNLRFSMLMMRVCDNGVHNISLTSGIDTIKCVFCVLCVCVVYVHFVHAISMCVSVKDHDAEATQQPLTT